MGRMCDPDTLALGASRPNAMHPITRFEEVVGANEEGLDVPLAAALIARDAYEDLDVVALLKQFDQLAAPLQKLGWSKTAGAEAQALKLAHDIYERQGFAGNENDYYDPKKQPAPPMYSSGVSASPSRWPSSIAKSLKRVNVPAQRRRFPRSLLGSHRPSGAAPTASSPVIVDPFFGGRILDERSVAALLPACGRPAREASPRAPSSRVAASHAVCRCGQPENGLPFARRNSRALLALDRFVTLMPEAPSSCESAASSPLGSARSKSHAPIWPIPPALPGRDRRQNLRLGSTQSTPNGAG